MIEIQGYKFWLDNYFKSNLDIGLKEAIPNKWDWLCIILGNEGVGKSTLGTQQAIYLDNNFNIDNVVFTPDQFDTAVENAEPESAILWDEAITGANIKNHATSINIALISKLTQIRFKKLKIILCIPYLYLLERYFISRCLCGIYVYAKDFDDRGYANFYNQPQMEYLYYLQKIKYPMNPNKSYSEAKKGFFFKFHKCFCLPEDEYDKKKEAGRTAKAGDTGISIKQLVLETMRINPELAKDTQKLADIFKISRRYVQMLKKNSNIE